MFTEIATYRLNKEQIRTFLVVYHHLTHKTTFSCVEDILTYIKKVGCIQYDPINYLAYNSHLVLQSRFPSYNKQMLDMLLYERFMLIDGWDKNLSIYSVEDDKKMFHYRQRAKAYHSKLDGLINEAKPTVLDAMNKLGPLTSIDIKDSPTIDWWWAPTKAVRAALDHMFACGDIYVHHKVNTRKYYDLISNHPIINRDDSESFFSSDHERLKWQVLRRIAGVGILPAERNSYAFIAIDGLKAKHRRQIIEELLIEHRITAIEIEGVKDTYYTKSTNMPLINAIIEDSTDLLLKDADGHKKASIIAPLDNLIWDRDMIKELFNFDYIWEVYKPKSERVYGYYVLPILYGNQFVGRVEAKHNRDKDTLEIVNWYFEHTDTQTEEHIMAYARMLKDFRCFLEVSKVKIMPSCKNKKIVGQIRKTQFTL